MSDFLYRFRPLKRILESELKNSEIFFADPKSLNDPAEGYKDIFWKGDTILWKNFLKNYLIAFDYTYTLITLYDKQEEVERNWVKVRNTYNSLPTNLYRSKMDRVFNIFFSQNAINKLIENLSKRDSIRKDELSLYLNTIHMYVFELVHAENNNTNIKSTGSLDSIEKFVASDFFKLLDHEDVRDKKNMMFEVFSQVTQSQKLHFLLNSPDEKKWRIEYLVINFIDQYIIQIEELLYPEWYCASFMENITNPAIWGYYGEEHRGLCLKFIIESKNESPIHLTNKMDQSAQKEFKFQKVNYTSKIPEIDFFNHLGRSSRNILIRDWFSDENGMTSKLIDKILTNEDEWRKTYWKYFYECNGTKMDAWEPESEFRLILASFFNDHSDKSTRLFNYDFNQLEGIVFGATSDIENKKKVIEIIKAKCKEIGRTDFSFYQMRYDHNKGTMYESNLHIKL